MWCGNDFKLLILGSNQREEYIYMSKLQEELIDARKIHIARVNMENTEKILSHKGAKSQ